MEAAFAVMGCSDLPHDREKWGKMQKRDDLFRDHPVQLLCNAYAVYAPTNFTTSANASGLLAARSASTLRLMSICFLFIASMRRE